MGKRSTRQTTRIVPAEKTVTPARAFNAVFSGFELCAQFTATHTNKWEMSKHIMITHLDNRRIPALSWRNCLTGLLQLRLNECTESVSAMARIRFEWPCSSKISDATQTNIRNRRQRSFRHVPSMTTNLCLASTGRLIHPQSYEKWRQFAWRQICEWNGPFKNVAGNQWRTCSQVWHITCNHVSSIVKL
jgi:hypothetical protein